MLRHERLTWAKASYRSIRGLAESSWRFEKGTFHLDVTVPVGCSATVFVPARDGVPVTESGKPAATSEGVTAGGQVADDRVFRVTSGRYSFATPR